MAAQRGPWWQTAKTSRTAFLLGGGWLLFALLRWVAFATGDRGFFPNWLDVTVGVLMTVLAVAYLVSAVLMRRRERVVRSRL